MVSAISRHSTNEIVIEDSTLSRLLLPVHDERFPCALREFVNSNADLPTIDDLVKNSAKLAEAIGMVH